MWEPIRYEVSWIFLKRNKTLDYNGIPCWWFRVRFGMYMLNGLFYLWPVLGVSTLLDSSAVGVPMSTTLTLLFISLFYFTIRPIVDVRIVVLCYCRSILCHSTCILCTRPQLMLVHISLPFANAQIDEAWTIRGGIHSYYLARAIEGIGVSPWGRQNPQRH